MRKENLFLYLARPDIFIKTLIRRFNIGSFEFREKFDAFSRPSYAFGIYRAAKEANALGYDKISIIEFGVGGGRGLKSMTEIIREVERLFPSLSLSTALTRSRVYQNPLTPKTNSIYGTRANFLMKDRSRIKPSSLLEM